MGDQVFRSKIHWSGLIAPYGRSELIEVVNARENVGLMLHPTWISMDGMGPRWIIPSVSSPLFYHRWAYPPWMAYSIHGRTTISPKCRPRQISSSAKKSAFAPQTCIYLLINHLSGESDLLFSGGPLPGIILLSSIVNTGLLVCEVRKITKRPRSRRPL